jgi:hypothetical protein
VNQGLVRVARPPEGLDGSKPGDAGIAASACGGNNVFLRETVNLPTADHIFQYRIAATANFRLARNNLVRKELP